MKSQKFLNITKLLRNIQIRHRVIIMAVISISLIFILALGSLTQLKNKNQNTEKTYNKLINEYTLLNEINSDMNFVTSHYFNMHSKGIFDENEYLAAKEEMEEISQNSNEFKNIIGSENHTSLPVISQVVDEIDGKYLPSMENSFMLLKDGKLDESFELYKNNVVEPSKNISDGLEKMEDTFDETIADFKVSQESAAANLILLVIIAVSVVLVILFIVSALIIKSIDVSIKELMITTEEIAKGNLDIHIDTSNKDETGILAGNLKQVVDSIKYLVNNLKTMYEQDKAGKLQVSMDTDKLVGEYKLVGENINEMIEALGTSYITLLNILDNFSKGKFDFEIDRQPGEKVIINNAVDSVKANMDKLTSDMNYLIQNIMIGEFNDTLSTEGYEGEWKELINDFNMIIKTVKEPFEDTAVAITKISEGDFDFHIEKDYKGVYGNIKDSVNQTIDSVSSYINEISDTLGQMANKNFDVSIDREYRGAFDDIRKSIAHIVEELNNVFSEIDQASYQIAIGAKSISDSSISLAEGATNQANDIVNLNKVLDTVTEATEDTFKIAIDVSDKVKNAKDVANLGNNEMQKMLSAMEEIDKANQDISEILETINNISFQTNLLALNAAVEAARAGEHGKGFAVVADEVRNLALRSKKAAEDSKSIIENTLQKTQEGSDTANNTAQRLYEIIESVTTVSDMANQIATSAKENNDSIKEINHSIQDIESVTLNNTSTSQENAAASEELMSQSETFRNIIEQFNLKNII